MASDDLEETHTFRCEIADFKDFLKGNTQYRYEIACGEKFGEKIPINFEMYLPSKDGSGTFYLKGGKFENKNSHTQVEYIGLKAGVDALIQKPISLIVVPRLLKSDCTIYHFGASRQIKLNQEKKMLWNQFIKVDTLHSTRGLATDNKVIIEFDVRLFPYQKSILVKPMQENKEDSSPKSQAQTIPRSTNRPRSSSGRSSNNNGANKDSSDKLTNTEDDVLILDDKPNDVVKLEAMHLKLSTDLRSVLKSQDKADVVFKVKDGSTVKGHRLILAARSDALNEMLADEKKQEDGTWLIEAEDLEPEIMETILEYIYTGKLGLEFDKHVHQLLIAAHKFKLRELVEYLDLKVPDLLTVENISDFLILSKTMELKHLEHVMTKYFVQHRAEVVQTKGFAELREKNPGILVDWLLALN